LHSAERLSTIGATTGPDRKNVYETLGISAVEDHPPLAHTQPPESVGASQQLDIAVGQCINRRADPLSIASAKSAQ
jgi:hypothetical protein